MATLEQVSEELIKRGATKHQASSRLVAMVMDICANTGEEFKNAYDTMQQVEREKKALEYRKRAFDREMKNRIAGMDKRESELLKRETLLFERETISASERRAKRTATFFSDSVREFGVDSERVKELYISGLLQILLSKPQDYKSQEDSENGSKQ